MANEVINKKPTMSVVLASSSIKELCNSLSLTSEQINRAKSTALELSSDPKLASCDPFSLVKFCFETARYNFTRNDCIYPVPYGNKVQAQLGYKGLREICLKSGFYKEVNCNEVYSCDKVYRDRETGQIKVEFNEDVNATVNAKVIGYYAYAIDSNLEVTNSLYWSVEQVTKHGKHYSKSYNSIWGDEFGFSKMAKKTVIKQLCSTLRTTPELQQAIKQDQIVYGGENEKDDYLDNPLNDTKSDGKKRVTNTIPEVNYDLDNNVIDADIEETDNDNESSTNDLFK